MLSMLFLLEKIFFLAVLYVIRLNNYFKLAECPKSSLLFCCIIKLLSNFNFVEYRELLFVNILDLVEHHEFFLWNILECTEYFEIFLLIPWNIWDSLHRV